MTQRIRDLEIAEAYAVTQLWHHGLLQYKFKPCQHAMLEAIQKADKFKYVIKCARRLGKSYLLVSLAIMTCLKKEKSQVRYAAPTAKALRKIIHPIMDKILADCPPTLKPEWKSIEGMYVFKNGSQLHLAGVNNGHSDDLRGTAADLFLIDEAGTIDDLQYLIDDVAMPQFLDSDKKVVEGRRLILASSPPRTPAHEFTQIANTAKMNGNYSHYNIFDGEYSPEIIRMFLEEDGVPEGDIVALLSGNTSGVKSTTVKREYLALDVVDQESAIIPEWDDRYIQDIQRDEHFQFYCKYEGLDIGVRDLTVCLVGYYDFLRAAVIIVDEVVMSGPQMTTERLAEAVRAKEEEHFGTKWEQTEIEGKRRWRSTPVKDHKIRRISDIDLLLINDMTLIHGLFFDPTDKGHLDEMTNQLRIWVGSGRVLVHSRCKNLIDCMRYGIWDEDRKKWERADRLGHFDALAALMYLVRNIDTRTNPIPTNYGRPEDEYFYTKDPMIAKREKLRSMFNIRDFTKR